MKKLLIILLIVFVGGCNAEPTYYEEVIEEVSLASESTEIPCEIEVLAEEDFYYVTFDEPKNTMLNVKALVVGGEEVSSIGFLDDTVNMEEGMVDKETNYVKGVILSGVINESTLKIYIEYEDHLGVIYKSYYIYEIETE